MRCQHCGVAISQAAATLRQDQLTGEDYLFCSEACARQWAAARDAAARAEEDSQAHQRWTYEGGARGPTTRDK